MTSPPTNSCASLLRDASRRLTHEVNNAANGVAVNLEVVRIRGSGATSGAGDGSAPFAARAAEQLEVLTGLHELVRSLLLLTIGAIDEDRLSCQLSPSGDAFEITFPNVAVPRALAPGDGDKAGIGLRNSPRGVILSVPRNSPSSE